MTSPRHELRQFLTQRFSKAELRLLVTDHFASAARDVNWDRAANQTASQVIDVLERRGEIEALWPILLKERAKLATDLERIRHAWNGQRPGPVASPQTSLKLLVLIPTLLLVVGGWSATMVHLPTWVDIDVVTRRLDFTVSPDHDQVVELLSANRQIEWLKVESCQTLTFEPERLWMANPDLALPPSSPTAYEAIRFPESAWVKLTGVGGAVRFACAGELAEITLRPVSSDAVGAGALTSLRAGPSDNVVVEVSADGLGDLTIDTTRPQTLRVNTAIDLQIETIDVELEGLNRLEGHEGLEGIDALLGSDPKYYRADVQRNMVTTFRFESAPDRTTVILRPSDQQPAEELFDRTAIPMASVRLLEDDPAESALVEATLRYEDRTEDLALTRGEFLVLDGLHQMTGVVALAPGPTPDSGGRVGVRLQGRVGRLETGRPSALVDRRITLDEWVWRRGRLGLLATLVVWGLSTTLLVRRVLRDRRRDEGP